MNAMCKVSLWLLAVAVLSLSCQVEPHEPPPSELPSSELPPSTPEICRDVPSLYDVNGYASQIRCNWNAAALTWVCGWGLMGPNWAVHEDARARYLSEADVVAERTLGVVRAVESSYTWATSKGGSKTEHGVYTYDDKRRLVMKKIGYVEFLIPDFPLFQDEVYTFSDWDEQGRPLAGTYTSKSRDKDGAEPIPSCSDIFTLSYDDAAGRIIQTPGTTGCPRLAFNFSAVELNVHTLGERLLFSPRTVTVHETQRICVPE